LIRNRSCKDQLILAFAYQGPEENNHQALTEGTYECHRKETEELKRQIQSLTEEREQWKQNHQAVTKENEELKGQIQRLTEMIKIHEGASEQSVHKITTELSKHQEATRTGAGLQVPLPLRFAAAH